MIEIHREQIESHGRALLHIEQQIEKHVTIFPARQTDHHAIAIFDHPKNPGYPTYWHARGYGLFAANPLAPKIFTDNKAPALNFTLEPNQSATFRYRVLILPKIATAADAEANYKSFIAAVD